MADARRNLETRHEPAAHPGVRQRAAEDWFVDPASDSPHFVPDPLSVDPTELVPVSEGIEASLEGLSPLQLLLGDTGDQYAWQEQALCAQTDPEAFFPEKGGSTREAKRVCASCEVRAECLEYALTNDERFGIWGGMSERERRRLKKQVV